MQHLDGSWQFPLSWPSSPQLQHILLFLQFSEPCPYVWQLKDLNGLGINRSTGTLIYPIVILSSGWGFLTVIMYMPVLICLFFWLLFSSHASLLEFWVRSISSFYTSSNFLGTDHSFAVIKSGMWKDLYFKWAKKFTQSIFSALAFLDHSTRICPDLSFFTPFTAPAIPLMPLWMTKGDFVIGISKDIE